MIPYNKLTIHDFLSLEMMEKLRKAGMKMKDAKYCIVRYVSSGQIEVALRTEVVILRKFACQILIPTYTLPELERKLIKHTDKGDLKHGWMMWNGTPYYFYKYGDVDEDNPLFVMHESPIYSAAMLLHNCIKEGVGYVDDIRANSKQPKS